MTEAELSRAKKATVSAVLSNLESRAIVAEDIGRQILTYGDRCTRRPGCRSRAWSLCCRARAQCCEAHAFMLDTLCLQGSAAGIAGNDQRAGDTRVENLTVLDLLCCKPMTDFID